MRVMCPISQILSLPLAAKSGSLVQSERFLWSLACLSSRGRAAQLLQDSTHVSFLMQSLGSICPLNAIEKWSVALIVLGMVADNPIQPLHQLYHAVDTRIGSDDQPRVD